MAPSTKIGRGSYTIILKQTSAGVVLVALCYGAAQAQLVVPPFLQDGPGATARALPDKMRDTVNVKDYGAKCDGITDDTPAFTRALANHDVVVVTSAGCAVKAGPLVGTAQYRIKGTIKVQANQHLMPESRNVWLSRRSEDSNTDPVVALLGNFASISNGTIWSEKATPSGVLSVCKSATGDQIAYSCNYVNVGSPRLLGPGGSMSNVGLYVYSHQPGSCGGSCSTFFGTFGPGLMIDSFGIDVKLTNGVNAHDFYGLHHQQTYLKAYELQGAYANKFFGGFVHSLDPRSPGVTIINLLSATGKDGDGRPFINPTMQNFFFGTGGEPGGASRSADIGSAAINNTLFLMHNTMFGPADAGSSNLVVYNGTIFSGVNNWGNVTYNARNFSQIGRGSWAVAEASQKTYQYKRLGREMTLNVSLTNTTVSGVVSALKVKIPDSLHPNKRIVVPVQYSDGGTFGTGAADIDPGADGWISIMKNIGGTANWSGPTAVFFSATFETQ